MQFCLQTNSLQRVFERSSFGFPQFFSSLLNFVSSPGYCPAANIVALPKLMIASDRKMISRKENCFLYLVKELHCCGKISCGAPHTRNRGVLAMWQSWRHRIECIRKQSHYVVSLVLPVLLTRTFVTLPFASQREHHCISEYFFI